MLEALEITVSYGERKVLDGVSLYAEPGLVTALLGPNGAGKSTLMKALNGAVTIAKGKVVLDGHAIRKWPRRTVARRVAVAAQEGDFRFPITVLEFVLGGRFASASVWETEEDIAAAIEALSDTGMLGFVSRMMNELSGGERQSVIIARALATGAGIFLLDEPTANLDLAHQARMLGLIEMRCRQRNAAAVVVTHDLNLASEFADRIILLKDGKLIAAGVPTDVMVEEILEEVFDIRVVVDRHPVSGVPRITPVHERAPIT